MEQHRPTTAGRSHAYHYRSLALDAVRDVPILQEALDGLGQLAGHRHGVDARDQAHYHNHDHRRDTALAAVDRSTPSHGGTHRCAATWPPSSPWAPSSRSFCAVQPVVSHARHTHTRALASRSAPLKVGRGALGDALAVVGHLQEGAVLAARVVELRERLDERARHARAELAERVGDLRVHERLVQLLVLLVAHAPAHPARQVVARRRLPAASTRFQYVRWDGGGVWLASEGETPRRTAPIRYDVCHFAPTKYDSIRQNALNLHSYFRCQI